MNPILFNLSTDFIAHKNAVITNNTTNLNVAATSNKLTSPGILTNAVDLKAGTYVLHVVALAGEDSKPYIYTNQSKRREYITTTESERVTLNLPLILLSDTSFRAGILLENAKSLDNFTIYEMVIRDVTNKNMAQTRFDMTMSQIRVLANSELIIGYIKFRWNKAETRFEIAGNTYNRNITIFNIVNNQDYNTGSSDEVLRNGFIELNSNYVPFYTDVGETTLDVEIGYYKLYKFEILTDNFNETYQIEVFMNGLGYMTIRILFIEG